MKPWEVKKLYAKLIALKEYPICPLCGECITNMLNFTFDHIVPKSRGGADSLDNFQPAHRDCNESRGDKYLKRQEFISPDESIISVKVSYKTRNGESWNVRIEYNENMEVQNRVETFVETRKKQKCERKRARIR